MPPSLHSHPSAMTVRTSCDVGLQHASLPPALHSHPSAMTVRTSCDVGLHHASLPPALHSHPSMTVRTSCHVGLHHASLPPSLHSHPSAMIVRTSCHVGLHHAPMPVPSPSPILTPILISHTPPSAVFVSCRTVPHVSIYSEAQKLSNCFILQTMHRWSYMWKACSLTYLRSTCDQLHTKSTPRVGHVRIKRAQCA